MQHNPQVSTELNNPPPTVNGDELSALTPDSPEIQEVLNSQEYYCDNTQAIDAGKPWNGSWKCIYATLNSSKTKYMALMITVLTSSNRPYLAVGVKEWNKSGSGWSGPSSTYETEWLLNATQRTKVTNGDVSLETESRIIKPNPITIPLSSGTHQLNLYISSLFMYNQKFRVPVSIPSISVTLNI